MAEAMDTGSRPQEAASVTRRAVYLYADSKVPDSRWGLALSGGGIRSATFCLGVLQALAQAKFAHSGSVAKDAKLPLLARFDLLSTVSGGGYIGSFLSGLFRPRQRDDNGNKIDYVAKDAADKAYATLKSDPPGRMGGPTTAQATDLPLRWLRENGRYLAPSGTGDLLYDITIALRNLAAIHYVAAITLVTLFLFAFAFRYLTTMYLPELAAYIGTPYLPGFVANIPANIEAFVQPECWTLPGAIWWSPWFITAAVWFVAGMIPIGVAYWYRQDEPSNKAPSLLRTPWVVAAILCLCSIATYGLTFDVSVVDALSNPIQNGKATVLIALSGILAISIAVFLVANRNTGKASRVFRAKITGWLAWSLRRALLILAFGLIETGGQTLYLWLSTRESAPMTVASIGAFIAALITLVRSFAPALAQTEKDSLLQKLPLDFILGAAGVVLLVLILVSWHAMATYLFMGDFHQLKLGEEALIKSAQFKLFQEVAPGMFLAVCVMATCAAGYFLGFINLSSLQTMYSARLSRAYLGASNRTRFPDRGGRDYQPVTQPDADDDFDHAAFYDDRNLGPAHIINVTINATTGSGDQLTQRDRQGLPMSITPDGVTVEGAPWVPEDFGGKTLAVEALKIGQWIGISGAAFSTGIGRGTSLGKSLVLGIANVRLGWWWNSGLQDKQRLQPLWRNQTYLRRELLASFMGKDGSHWYLSDGGHFENTAVFELMRRQVDVAVCCDCGADPDYQFEDLANLMRLARIDLNAEFKPIRPADSPVLLARASELDPFVALDINELKSNAGADNKCALLYQVTYPSADKKTPGKTTLLIVIKPRLIKDAPLDIVQYHSANPTFPQQSTTDQFFDDAQWESYRKLGVLIGSKIFPG